MKLDANRNVHTHTQYRHPIWSSTLDIPIWVKSKMKGLGFTYVSGRVLLETHTGPLEPI